MLYRNLYFFIIWPEYDVFSLLNAKLNVVNFKLQVSTVRSSII